MESFRSKFLILQMRKLAQKGRVTALRLNSATNHQGGRLRALLPSTSSRVFSLGSCLQHRSDCGLAGSSAPAPLA